MKKNPKSYLFVRLIPLVLLIVIAILTLGYSNVIDNLAIDASRVTVRADANIRLTSLRLWETTNGGAATGTEFSITHLTSSINLPNSDSTVNFLVSVTNAGNVEMGLTEILGLPSNLEYTIDGYTLEATLCDSNNNSICKLGSVTTFNVIVGYAENGYNSSNTNYFIDMEFNFEEMVYTARIGNKYYTTIQAAIDEAPTNHTETTIVLLKNTYDRIKIWSGNNIVLDMPNLVLHNKEFVNTGGNSGDPVVEIFGTKDKNGQTVNGGTSTFKMINGTIASEANQSAINCEAGSTFIMTGGTIIASGNRQAVYIKDGAAAEISGTAHLKAMALVDLSKNNYRATAHVVNGTLTITGGTIESYGGDGIAVTNESVLVLGTEGSGVSTTVPNIIGNSIGMHLKAGSTTSFYDGIIKGKTMAIRNVSEIGTIETGYDIINSGETINGSDYFTALLGHSIIITLHPEGGTLTDTQVSIGQGVPVGPLPIPTRAGYDFDGWYTQGGVLVQRTDTFNAATNLYAHWTESPVAQIGDNTYTTLAAAVSSIKNNTPTTIHLLKDTSEKITIASNRTIEFDFGSYTLSNTGNNIPVTNNGTLTITSGTISMSSTAAAITNNGTLTIHGGTIRSSSTNTSAINNTAGATLVMDGGSIIATGLRQAIYDTGGTVRISGTAYLSASAKVESGKNRGTVQNDTSSNSKIYITGGTIISTATDGIAVSNMATLTIGEKDGNISTTSPVIQGVGKGVHNTGTFNFYDGILQSPGTPLSGSTSDTDGTYTTGTTTIGNVTYNTAYLSQ